MVPARITNPRQRGDSYHVWKQKGTDFEKVTIYQDINLDCLPPNSHDRISQPELNHIAGFPTVNYTCVLYPYESGNDPGNLLASVTYYDVKGRLLQSHSKNHCNGYDHFTNQYVGLTNLVLATDHRHSTRFATINDVTETIVNGYDPVGRLVEKRYFFQDETPKTVITNTYNTLGQLSTRQIGDGTYLMQNILYKYNIRGWLTKINDPTTVSATGDLFGMELLYNIQNTTLQNTPAFNGNISAAIWQTAQPTGTTTPVTTGIKSYKYSYDKLNRLLSGVFTGNTALNENYSEYIDVSTMVSGTTPYDLNGNILTLRRYGKRNNAFNTIDELTYTYDGNKLIAVDDVVATDNGGDFYEAGKKYIAGGIHEYIYDANGNLTTDDNKKIISITYNHLNLPATINKTGGNRIVYTYDASGNKVRQDYYINGTITKTTDFIGNFVYENGLPSCIVYDEGRVVYANNSRTYFGEIYLKDHLGNVRIACRRENGVLKTRQVDSYYPFGMNIKGLSANSTDVNRPNEYLYNGKMMQDEMGLNWLDYGARFYDPVLGRWHAIDNKSENYYLITPYAYAVNNPINALDPDGNVVIFVNGMHGGSGGSAKYWNGLNTRVMNRIGDHHARYYDGSNGGAINTAIRGILTGNNLISGNRRRSGERAALKDASTIYGNLKEGESIKVVSHSMGGAYAKGFIQGLEKYAKEQGISLNVEFEVDMANFQSGFQKAEDGVPTTQISHEGDIVAGTEDLEGAKNVITRKGEDKSLDEHSVDSFSQEEVDKNVPTSVNNSPGSSTWEEKPKK